MRHHGTHSIGGLLRRLVRVFVLALLLAAVLPGCGGSGGSSTPAEAAPAKAAPKASAQEEKASGASFALPAEVRVPKMRVTTDPTTIDTSGVNSGYVGAAARSSSRLKFQVACGEMAYNYDLPSDGTPVLFPVNMGNGDYAFRIMENIEGSTYAELDAAYVSVKLSSEFDPYLIPNIYCSYTADSACVAKAREICAKATNEGEAVREVCNFVAAHVSYDYDKAETLAKSSGYIPNPDETLSTKKGVCFDFAALSAAMLRSLGLPTKVMTGYVSPSNLYHSWIMVYADGTWQSAQFSVKPNQWSRCDVTFASAGAGSVTGDGTTYTDRYAY